MDNAENLILFKDLFRQGFIRPQLITKQFKEVWSDLEGWTDTLAGPLYSIYVDENCDYIFCDSETRFKGIKSEDEFLVWCLGIVEEHRRGANKIEAKTENELTDQLILLSQTDIMEKLSHLAVDIQRHRTGKIK
jgi:hypothetical protein